MAVVCTFLFLTSFPEPYSQRCDRTKCEKPSSQEKVSAHVAICVDQNNGEARQTETKSKQERDCH